jgi:D-alanyl-D-alanine carboxypeptidase
MQDVNLTHDMITRRIFIAFCSGLTASLFAAGHSRLRPATAVKKNGDFVGPPLPIPKAPVATRKYATPISDLDPDNIVVDNIATYQTEDSLQAPADFILNEAQRKMIDSVLSKLLRLQRFVGYGNFNIIGWDQSLRLASSREQIGSFSKAELEFIEELFFTNANSLGFYGDKVVTRLSTTIPKQDVLKVPGTGHYLFKGIAADTYRKIRRDLGESIVLTSGIRSVVKQIYLFLNKAAKVEGNLSLASYSLAPPGHSYHAIGDFDVGKKGFGHKNFNKEFAQTDEFKRLIDLGYLDIRYPQQNPYGVRYEPWHIKVV